MASPRERRGAAPSGPPAFADRTEAGVLLGAAVRGVLANFTLYPAERMRASARPAPGSPGRGAASLRVFALPRGGVPVAAGVAAALGVPLDVLMVRKIGHPDAPELGLGAIAEDGAGGAGEPFFDPEMLARAGLTEADLAGVVARERAELARRAAVYTRHPVPRPRVGDPPGSGRGPGPGPTGARPPDAPGPERSAGNTGTPGREPKGAPRPAASAGSTGIVVVVDDGLATGVTARAALRAVRARGPVRAVLAVPVAAPPALRAVGLAADAVVTLVTPRGFSSVGEWYADFRQLSDEDVLGYLPGEMEQPPSARADGG